MTRFSPSLTDRMSDRGRFQSHTTLFGDIMGGTSTIFEQDIKPISVSPPSTHPDPHQTARGHDGGALEKSVPQQHRVAAEDAAIRLGRVSLFSCLFTSLSLPDIAI